MSLHPLMCRLERGLCLLADLLREHMRRRRVLLLRLLPGDEERRRLLPPLSRLAKSACRLKWGGGDSILGERKRSETRTPRLIPRSPGKRRRFLSEAFEFQGRQGKVFRSSGERGTRISESGESPVRNRPSSNMSTQWDSRDSKSSGSSFLSNSWTSSCSTQTTASKTEKILC